MVAAEYPPQEPEFSQAEPGAPGAEGRRHKRVELSGQSTAQQLHRALQRWIPALLHVLHRRLDDDIGRDADPDELASIGIGVPFAADVRVATARQVDGQRLPGAVGRNIESQ